MNELNRQVLKDKFDELYIGVNYYDETVNEFLEKCVDLTIKTINNCVNTSNTVWRPISEATQDINCGEIIGCRMHNDVMTREPFITFWSPTLQMYYCDPSHWIAMPTMPAITPVNTEVKEQFKAELDELQHEDVLTKECITSTWYPISTAPKDGTYILITSSTDYTNPPREIVVCSWNNKYNTWWNCEWGKVYGDNSEPIYWHPLLEIPSNAE